MSRRRQTNFGSTNHNNPPSYFLLLVAFLLVFGVFFLLQGLRNFTANRGGFAADSATEDTAATLLANTVIAQRAATQTARPTLTPIPPCQDFVIRVPFANLRRAPDLQAEVLERLPEGQGICVIQPATTGMEWHLVDRNPNTRRVDTAYLHRSTIRALRPTPRPTATATPIPLATVTPIPQ